ncbi:glycerophosphodiester phosphodiesterase family protein [Nocardioides sp.]|jgi:glycerophosphoryl diester phosphodiesterase|uniref:glycerophosphodiester phosphodiesterase n=1 Tax=Nocardioides sp. TaxID=35761 RepID=UPI002601C994|nr:glycerophosphodiester phosphodiesterase family protein [Nocardioides sp.]
MRPQVVAHRGASATVAEHTLGAYLAALDAGAEGLECDVRLTADGHLVCVHDRKIRRTTGRHGTVSAMELADLAELDFASWKNPWTDLDDEAPMRDEALDRVLTLRTLLETVRDYTARTGRRVELAIETKHPTRYGGLVERTLAEMLAEFGWDKAGAPVRIMSFSFTALQRMERLTPELRLVQLIDHQRNWTLLQSAIGPNWVVGPGIATLTKHPKLARKITKAGHDLHVWTVNTEEALDLCLAAGVKAVITDKPAQMFTWLDQRGLLSD